MSAKAALALAISLQVAVLTVAPCLGAPATDPLDRILNGPATQQELAYANGTLYAEHCEDKFCLALDDVVRGIELLWASGHPGGQQWLSGHAPDPRKIVRQAKRLMHAHPDRKADYCRILTKWLSHWAPDEDIAVERYGIELASLVSNPCAARVASALPTSPEAEHALREARDFCEPGLQPGCQFMRRHNLPP
jgi:hypothetical protein